jgi:lipase chaperone LimK
VRTLAIAAALLAALFAILAVDGVRREATAVAEPGTVPRPRARAEHTAPIASVPSRRVPRVDYVLATSSLRGSAVDGGVVFDGARVVPDRELRRLFDWWLSLDGELSPAAIRGTFAQWLVGRHDAAAAQRVLDLFDRYVHYRAAAAGVDGKLALDQRLARLHELRVAWLGRELADAFFADEEREAAQALARRFVAGDALLTRDERVARIAALDAALPAPEREAREAELEPWLVEVQTHALADAPAAERRRERSALWGAAAAGRLAALDKARDEWDARIADYLRARAGLLRATPPVDRATALAELRARSFAPHEARRVESLEAIGELPGG